MELLSSGRFIRVQEWEKTRQWTAMWGMLAEMEISAIAVITTLPVTLVRQGRNERRWSDMGAVARKRWRAYLPFKWLRYAGHCGGKHCNSISVSEQLPDPYCTICTYIHIRGLNQNQSQPLPTRIHQQTHTSMCAYKDM